MLHSYTFALQNLSTPVGSGVEVKLICPDADLNLDLETNDIPYSIPRFKEELLIDTKYTPVSQAREETHYKAWRETDEFHPSCWYKSKVDVNVESKPQKYLSTFYLIPKDDTCISEVEFWMTGKQRRKSLKEDYFMRKVSEDERQVVEQLGIV
jgi:hypothetical protein